MPLAVADFALTRKIVSASQDQTCEIRELIDAWMRATAAGDMQALLDLTAEDVVFLQPGLPPMRGRQAFAAAFAEAIKHFRIQATSQIQEIQIDGDTAWCWNFLTVTLTPAAGGAPMRRSGNVLTVLRKTRNGRWQVFRDANLLVAEKTPSA